MKLELNREEVETALLAYVDQKWPGMFNTVSGTSYSSIPGAVFTHEEQKQQEKSNVPSAS